MAVTQTGLAHDGALARRDHPAPAAGSADPAARAPVVVLATGYSGASRLRSLLRLPDLAWTSGTGILPLCEQAAAVWRNADGLPEGATLSRLAAASTRALTDSVITSILLHEGKRRWCEICSGMPEVAETFAQLYPSTRFVCLHRSCPDFIRAVLDASPWGIADPAFAVFARTQPASTVAALTAYWAAHTGSSLAFERSHPRAVLRIRFEDLAAAEQQTTRAVMSFLGIASLDSDAASARDSQAAQEPGTPHGGTDFPAGRIPPAVLAQANDLLRQLDYPPLPG